MSALLREHGDLRPPILTFATCYHYAGPQGRECSPERSKGRRTPPKKNRAAVALSKLGNQKQPTTAQGEVLREGLRLLKEREDLERLRLAELRHEIKRGVEQADRGEFVDGPQTFARSRQKSAKRKRGTC